MIYEFCAENVTNLEKAMQAGARRIELCDNLAVGGTTPSYGVIKAAVELAKPYNLPFPEPLVECGNSLLIFLSQ